MAVPPRRAATLTSARASMTETVRAWRYYLPEYLPLPHPSWRNTGWLKRNPWFGEELLPQLRAEVAVAMSPPGAGQR